MRNTHTGGATAQSLDDGALLQEYGDATKVEGCGGHKSVSGDGVQFDRGGGGEEKI